MTETPKAGLPKVAAAKLRASGVVSAHPDANLLAAFSEKALGQSEREEVLGHLAACADCREIVSLSQPPEEEKPVEVEARGWFGMRPEFMRWAIVGASATVVVAAVLLMKPEPGNNYADMRESTVRSDSQTAPRAESSAEQAPKAQESEVSKTRSANAGLANAGSGNAASANAGPARTLSAKPEELKDQAGSTSTYFGNDDKRDAASLMAKKNNSPAVSVFAPPPPPASASGRAMGGVIGGVMTTDRLAGNRPLPAAAPVVAEPAGAHQETESKVAGNLASLSQVPQAQAPEGQSPGNQVTNEKAEAVRGRSLEIARAKEKAGTKALADSSADSVEVNVAANSAAGKDDAARFTQPESPRGDKTPMKATKSSEAMTFRKSFLDAERTWRIADGKLQWSLDAGKTWHGIEAGSGVKFLSVDARQSSVWAGGTSGVVLRSQDGGATWAPVEKGWSGDVVYLKFEDAKRGILRTSSKEEWFTEDGGATWQRR